MKINKRIIPPKTWLNPDKHYLEIIENDWYKSILEIQNELFFQTNIFFQKKKMHLALLPITTGSISSPMGLGSDSKPVMINYFNKPTYLSDSMQFMLEYMCRFFENGAYYIMPSFRGEKVDERHLQQFFHVECEAVLSYEDMMIFVEEYVKFITQCIFTKYREELELICNNDVSHIKNLLNSKFKVITFESAMQLLSNETKYISNLGNGIRSITSEGEKELLKILGEPLWVKNYESLATPFYQSKISNTIYCKNADLLLGFGEIIGLGERCFDDKEVVLNLKEQMVNDKDYNWYINLKKQYPLHTSGFGMGIERYLMWLTKQHDIRDFQILIRKDGDKIEP